MTSDPIDTFLTFLRECEQRIQMAEADEKECGDRAQDILHSLELKQHNYHEYARLAKELVEVRRSRRTAKDILLELTPIVAWIAENRANIKSMERLLGEVRKVERRKENRTYTPRVKK